jgi:glc operon protein GlcG
MNADVNWLTESGALSEAATQIMMDHAVTKARSLGVVVTVSIVDPGGEALRLVRMDDIHAATVQVSLAKSRCAASFKRPTKVFQESYGAGSTAVAHLPGVVPFAGGLPIMKGKTLLGAIGCSGAAPDQDEQIAQAGLRAFQENLEN